MNQVIDIERDINLAKAGKQDLIYKTLVGLKSDLSAPAKIPEVLANKNLYVISDKDTDVSNNEEENSNNSEIGANSEDSKDDTEKKFINSSRPRNESPESKKVRKKRREHSVLIHFYAFIY